MRRLSVCLFVTYSFIWGSMYLYIHTDSTYNSTRDIHGSKTSGSPFDCLHFFCVSVFLVFITHHPTAAAVSCLVLSHLVLPCLVPRLVPLVSFLLIFYLAPSDVLFLVLLSTRGLLGEALIFCSSLSPPLLLACYQLALKRRMSWLRDCEVWDI